jgi:4-hydroxy-tetrahydrodipicolinate reductase
MKFALIGKGKTGSALLTLLGPSTVAVFDTQNKPSLSELAQTDVIFVFVPGDAMEALIPLLMQSKKPVICGSTGVKWPHDLNSQLKDQNLTWIKANNFSLSVNLMMFLTKILNQSLSLFPQARIHIHEEHHAHKKDAPSGTALKLQSFFEKSPSISWERLEDVKGTHRVDLETDHEKLSIIHESLDRTIFAQGALWAAQDLLKRSDLTPGLWEFEDIVTSSLKERLLHDL